MTTHGDDLVTRAEALIHREDAASCERHDPQTKADRYAFCPACIAARSLRNRANTGEEKPR